MSDPLDLLRIEGDEPLPPDHERAIRSGLAHLLGPAPTAGSPRAPRTPRTDAPPTPAAASPDPSPPLVASDAAGTSGLAGLAAKVGPYVLVALVSGGAGVGVGRITAPTAPVSSGMVASSTPRFTEGPSAPPSHSSVTAEPLPLPVVNTAPPSSGVASGATTGAPAAAPVVTLAPSAWGSASSSANVDAAEQSLLERARAALVRHDAQAAGQALDLYDQQFRRPRHAEERDYLRIQWARERGDQADVARRAKAFLAAYPESMLRARVEKLVATP